MRTIRLVTGLALFAGLVGCGGDEATPPEGTTTLRDDLPPAPQNGVRLVSPTFTVPAGKEVFMCLRIPYDGSEELHINRSVAFQSDGGHHTMLYYTDEDTGIEEAPHECDDEDMGNIRFVGVGTANGVGIELPEGVALGLPAGARLWTQSHYVNTSSEDLLVQDVIDLHLLEPEQVQHKAGAFTQVDLGLELTPAATTTRVIECTAPAEMNVPWMIPHMHEWGAHFKLELQRDGAWSTVYESDWHEALRDDFPVIEYEPHIALTPEDRIRTTCTWNNDTADPILFPKEMCATFLTFYPSSDGALLACDETGEHFEP